MQFDEPIDQILPIFIWNFILETSIQKVDWVHMLDFILSHVDNNFWNKFYNILWISYLKNIIEMQLGFVVPQELFAAIFLQFIYFSKFVDVKYWIG